MPKFIDKLLKRRKDVKCAIVFLTDKRIIIHAQSLAKSGFWISDDPFISLPAGASQEVVINNLIDTANKSRVGLPDPKDWLDFETKYLVKLGLKSWRDPTIEYLKMIHFKIETDFLTFIPTKQDSENPGGFFGIDDEVIIVNANAGMAEKIHALESTLLKCI